MAELYPSGTTYPGSGSYPGVYDSDTTVGTHLYPSSETYPGGYSYPGIYGDGGIITYAPVHDNTEYEDPLYAWLMRKRRVRTSFNSY